VILACNCDYGCPCNFNGLPTTGKCEGNWNWHITDGSYGDVPLSGLTFGVAVNWPTGIGARGSSGVAAALSSTDGGITYVDVAYTLKNHLKFAAVKNKAGTFALPGLTGIRSAAATINRVAPDNGGISIVNPAKTQKLAYPISTFTYVIIPKQTSKAAELKKFVNWALTKGQADGPKLLFSPIPKVVLKASVKTAALIHS
jgi:phosphate transport system substrate-binding protein